jgi:glycosyltransferase involved in cell wall biosynthesis
MRVMVVGGLARSLVNFRGLLLKDMVAAGHEVIASAAPATPNIVATLLDWGITFRPITLARAGLNPVGDLRTLAALRGLILEEKPNRILAYTAKPVIYSNLAARLAGRPPVYSMITGLGYGFGASSPLQRIVGKIVQMLYRRALASSAGVFFQNLDDCAVFQAKRLLRSDVPVTLINGSGVDLEWYTQQPLPSAPVFLLVARLLADKGIREYVAAARQLKRRYPQARFRIAGDLDPNPLSIPRAELDVWQKEGVIEYLGALDDIRPAFAEAEVYVLPSYREGTPRTVLEAMAMGRPIITTDAPGCRETVVHGRNGFLVPVRDAAALESAMERFILEPELAPAMGAESLAIAIEKFDVHKVNAVIMEAMELNG